MVAMYRERGQERRVDLSLIQFRWTNPIVPTKSLTPEMVKFADDVTNSMTRLSINSRPVVNELLNSILSIATHLANGDYSRIAVGEVHQSSVVLMVYSKQGTTDPIRIRSITRRGMSTVFVPLVTIDGMPLMIPITTLIGQSEETDD